jgi:hypothetical protein
MNDINQWFDGHRADYETVLGRLNRTRMTLLEGSVGEAADILEKSYVFAVLSIRTERERHERAFTAYFAGDATLKEAALMTVYGGNKKNWLRKTQESTDWESLAEAVRVHARAGRWDMLLEAVVDNLTGVSYRKGAFMLAMSGLYQYGCIDSNVARFAGLDELEDRTRFGSAEEYMTTCGEIFSRVGNSNWPPFVRQWAIYDMERGEHARHMAFYRELPIEI